MATMSSTYGINPLVVQNPLGYNTQVPSPSQMSGQTMLGTPLVSQDIFMSGPGISYPNDLGTVQPNDPWTGLGNWPGTTIPTGPGIDRPLGPEVPWPTDIPGEPNHGDPRPPDAPTDPTDPTAPDPWGWTPPDWWDEFNPFEPIQPFEWDPMSVSPIDRSGIDALIAQIQGYQMPELPGVPDYGQYIDPIMAQLGSYQPPELPPAPNYSGYIDPIMEELRAYMANPAQVNPQPYGDFGGILPALQEAVLAQVQNPGVIDQELFQGLYGTSMGLLDEQYGAAQQGLEANLAGRGLDYGSTAGGNLQDLATQRGRAGQEVMQNLLYNEWNNMANLRQAAVGNAVQTMGFEGAMQNQMYQQALAEAQFGAGQQQFGLQGLLQGGGMQMDAAGQAWANALQAAQFGHGAQMDIFGGQMQGAGMQQSAAMQEWANALQAGQFELGGQMDIFGMGLQGEGLGLNAQNADVRNQLDAYMANLSGQGQWYGQQSAERQWQDYQMNQARDQAMQDWALQNEAWQSAMTAWQSWVNNLMASGIDLASLSQDAVQDSIYAYLQAAGIYGDELEAWAQALMAMWMAAIPAFGG